MSVRDLLQAVCFGLCVSALVISYSRGCEVSDRIEQARWTTEALANIGNPQQLCVQVCGPLPELPNRY